MINSTETVTIIEKNFSHYEAKEILMSMLDSKINFHNIKNWSSQVQFGTDDAFAKK